MHKGAVLFGGGCLLLGVGVSLSCASRTSRVPKAEVPDDVVTREPVPRYDDPYVAEPLLSEAWTASNVEPMDHAALATIQRCEDEMLKRMDAAFLAAEANPSDYRMLEEKERATRSYREIISLSDTAVGHLFTPEVIAAAPWIDLLSDDRKASWIGSPLKGFEYRIENGVLHMVGPAEVGAEGIISIGDRERWRDLVLDVEFTLVSGECLLSLRVPRVWQENVTCIALPSDDGYYEAGVSHGLSVSLIGSSLIEEDLGEDSLGPLETKVTWTQVRKGALGISLPKNSEVRFTRLRAKILR